MGSEPGARRPGGSQAGRLRHYRNSYEVSMFEATVDQAKNLLRISYSERVGLEETKRCAEKLQSLVLELQPGFRLLTDLSGLEAMDVGCIVDIRQIMKLLDKRGIGMVARVIPDPRKDIGLNILSLFHYRKGVRILTCATMEEAVRWLEER